MKTVKIFLIATICCSVAITSSAQKTKTETFNVSGNCGMCEGKIEKAAKAAGASYAEWNKDTKIITVKFSSSTSNLAKIQKSIAGAGYDNAGAKAKDESYEQLHSCCKYERAVSADATKMPARTTQSDGDCCKDGKCSKEGHDGKDCCKKEQ
jgi:hypothetical protein